MPIFSSAQADRIERSLARVERLLAALVRNFNLNLEGAEQMAGTLQDILDRVTTIETVGDSTITLLQTLAQELRDARANDDQAKIDEIIGRMDAQAREMAEAVIANTPAAPPPEQPSA